MESLTFGQFLFVLAIGFGMLISHLTYTILDIHFYIKRGYRSWSDQDEEYFKTPYNIRIKQAWLELYNLFQLIFNKKR